MSRTTFGKIISAPLATGVLAFLLLVPTVLHVSDAAYGAGSGSCSGYCDTVEEDPEGCVGGCEAEVSPEDPVEAGDDLEIVFPEVEEGADLEIAIDQGDFSIITEPPADDEDLEEYIADIFEQPHIEGLDIEGLTEGTSDLKISITEFTTEDPPSELEDTFEDATTLKAVVTTDTGDVFHVLKVLQIEVEGIEHDAFESATITFRISRAELDALGISPGRVTLLHFVDGEWQTLRTQITSFEAGAASFLDVYVFSAETESFSLFAISGTARLERANDRGSGDSPHPGKKIYVGCNYDCSPEPGPDCDGYCPGYEPKEDDESVEPASTPPERLEKNAVCIADDACTALLGQVPLGSEVDVRFQIDAPQPVALPALGTADAEAFQLALAEMLRQAKVTGVSFRASGAVDDTPHVTITEFVPGDAGQTILPADVQTPVQNYVLRAAADGQTVTYKVVKLLEIEVVGTQPTEDATIRFVVLPEELEAFGLEAADVRLLHKEDGKWVALPTTAVGLEGNALAFEATTRSFSPFAIAGAAGEIGAISASSMNALWATAGIIGAIVVVAVVVLVIRKKKQG